MKTPVTGLFLSLVLLASSAHSNVRLTNEPSNSERPVVAIHSAGTVVVAWQDNRDGNYEIYWRKFTELGTPLTNEVRVTNTSGKSVRPDISCDGASNSYLVWQEGENVNGVGTVFFSILDTEGNRVITPDIQLGTFSGDARIYTESSGVSSVVWHKFSVSDQNVYYRRLSATGVTLCSQNFTLTLPAFNKTPCVVSIDGVAYMYWRDMGQWWVEGLWGGTVNQSCQKSYELKYQDDRVRHPAADALESGGTPWVVFEMAGKIYKFRSKNNACNFLSVSGNATLPRVATDGSKGFAIWQDSRDGNAEIYMCRYLDCPSETGDVRLTLDPAASNRPDIAAPKDSTGKWVAVWQDTRDGNSEIYMTGIEIRGYGALTGHVAETGGTPLLPGATVTVLQNGLEVARTTSDYNGRYTTPLLPIGLYNLRVERECYQMYEEFGIDVTMGLPTVRDIELDVATPDITAILPDTLIAGDTGIDIVIKGSGFQDGASVNFGAPDIQINHMSVWDNEQIHVNIDINTNMTPESVSVQVEDVCGHPGSQFFLPVNVLAGRHPRDYAPTFWFAQKEAWFPVSPLFADASGETSYNSPDERNQDYLAIDPNGRKSRAMVYYYVYGDDEPGIPFPTSDGVACIVYEYWLYFTFDEFVQCESIIWNRHQHDWEKFFVFVRKSDDKVVGLAGSAHLDFNANNIYEFANPQDPPYHPLVLVEWGGHATCPDMNGDGRFNRSVDVNGCKSEKAWGIQDLVSQRSDSDKIYSPDENLGTTYRLANLESIKQVVDPDLTEAKELWANSREKWCAQCFVASAPFFLAIEKWLVKYSTTTFVNSEVVPYDPASGMIFPLIRLCTVPCWQWGDYILTLAHAPIEHAWRGSQSEYLTQPRIILPGCYGDEAKGGLSGIVQNIGNPLECEMGIIFGGGGGGSWFAMKVQTDVLHSYPFAYSRIESDGSLGFENLDDGVYWFYLKPDGAAPYQQILNVTPDDTLLGVDGNIYLIPADQYFTIKVTVEDSAHAPLPWADVRFIIEPDTLYLPTLTDSSGSAYASADTARTYKVTVKAGEYEDSLASISGSFGDTVSVSFVRPEQPQIPALSLWGQAILLAFLAIVAVGLLRWKRQGSREAGCSKT